MSNTSFSKTSVGFGSLDNSSEINATYKIDSHQHFWQLSLGFYDWLTPELALLYRDYLPEDLSQEIVDADIHQTILIQAAEIETETDFLLRLASQTEYVAGVVGWVDMNSSSVLDTLQNLSEDVYFKGIRPMLQDIPCVEWILLERYQPIFEFLVKKGLSFDALIKAHQLPIIAKLAETYPALKIVINHCGKPHIDRKPSPDWKQYLTLFTLLDNVSIKFSGLLTEAPKGEVSVEQLQPYFEHVLSVFGTQRMMWGSDWPVVRLNGDYEHWMSLTKQLLSTLSKHEQRNVWAGNAQKFYHL